MSGSIKLLQFFQKSHQAMGIGSLQSNQEKQSSINSRRSFILISTIQLLLTVATFFFFEAESMFEYGVTFFVTVNTLKGVTMYLLLIWQRENTLKFIAHCDRFIAKRHDSRSEYEKCVRTIDQYSKYFCVYICVSAVIAGFLPLPYTVVRYCFYGMGNKSFYLTYQASYPFDWKTPLGYSLAFLGQAVGVSCVGIIYMQYLNLFFASCWFFIFIGKDITNDLTAFKTAVQTPNKNRAKLIQQFCNLAQIYSDAKECVRYFHEIYEFPLLTFFIWYLLSVSSVLVTLQFELWADHTDLLKIFILVYVGILVGSFIFIICEPSHYCTQQFENFGDELGQCDWYALPIELQRMYLIFLSDTQKEIEIDSYGNITCQRDTSKKIMNKTFSYFMTFRNFK